MQYCVSLSCKQSINVNSGFFGHLTERNTLEFVSYEDIALLLGKLGQGFVYLSRSLVAEELVFCRLGGWLRPGMGRQPIGMTFSRAELIAGPVGHARGEVTPQLATQLEGARRLGQRNENIVHHVFGSGGIVEKRHRHAEQIVEVLLLDTPQRVLTAASEPQLQQLILDHRAPCNFSERSFVPIITNEVAVPIPEICVLLRIRAATKAGVSLVRLW